MSELEERGRNRNQRGPQGAVGWGLCGSGRGGRWERQRETGRGGGGGADREGDVVDAKTEGASRVCVGALLMMGWTP